MSRVFIVALSVLVLSSCATVSSEPAWKVAVAGDGPGDPALLVSENVEVSNLPKSRSGNRPEYEVFGVRYTVLDSALDFKERGVASWYGSKFHGNATASGEIYDMHRLTAAHKHLPLPTFVRVTRIDNGQSIVVKVNDRGPFVDDRIIDLSYAAALELDMLDSGKAEVLVEALSHHGPGTQVPSGLAESTYSHAIQVGAFSEPINAQTLMEQVNRATHLPLYLDFENARQLYLVRIGPLRDEGSLDDALQKLTSAGIPGFRVTDSAR